MTEDKTNANNSEPVAGPMQRPVRPHVGDSDFESWFSTYSAPHSSYKQLLRDAYAAGMSDPAAVVAERDCRTCKHWTPHHRADVMHCSSPLRCVAGSSHSRQGVVQLWEAAIVDAGF